MEIKIDLYKLYWFRNPNGKVMVAIPMKNDGENYLCRTFGADLFCDDSKENADGYVDFGWQKTEKIDQTDLHNFEKNMMLNKIGFWD